MKPVNEGLCVGLQPKARADQPNRSARCCGQSRGLRVESCCKLPKRGVIDPVPSLDVKAQQIRMELLTHGDEVSHQRHSHLPAQEADSMKEGGECQRRLWFRESPRKNGLQDDRGDESDEGKRLAHSHKKLRPIEVRCRPRARVLGV